jgi:small ligand-binding sensory domain FIST
VALTRGAPLATEREDPIRGAAALSCTPEAGLAAAEAADAVAVALEGACDLAVVFATAEHIEAVEAVAAAVEARLEPGVLVGGIAQGVLGAGEEVESGPAVTVWGVRLATGHAQPFRSWAVPGPDGGVAVAGWPDSRPGDLVVVLADPYSFPAAEVATHVGDRWPGHLLTGGLITGGPGRSRLLLDDQVHEDGAVGVVLSELDVAAVVSQGCRPIGDPLTVTAADRNRILELGGEPATVRLQQLLHDSDPEVRELLRHGGLQLGLVVDEVRDDYGPGDFLVRGVLAIDADAGSLTVGDLPRVGQTVQFHVRDAASADQDLAQRLAEQPPAAAALLFTCNGRGRGLFGTADHDVTAVESTVGGAVAGAFCAGEIGPVGARSYLHGFTASLALVGTDVRGSDAPDDRGGKGPIAV